MGVFSLYNLVQKLDQWLWVPVFQYVLNFVAINLSGITGHIG